MIPDYQSLMRPVLACAVASETRIGDAVEQLADKLGLTPDERAQLLPSGKQTRFANRVNWAKAYLAMAGLVENTRRGYFRITPRGQAALADTVATINNAYLDQFKEFQDFKAKVNEADGATAAHHQRKRRRRRPSASKAAPKPRTRPCARHMPPSPAPWPPTCWTACARPRRLSSRS